MAAHGPDHDLWLDELDIRPLPGGFAPRPPAAPRTTESRATSRSTATNAGPVASPRPATGFRVHPPKPTQTFSPNQQAKMLSRSSKAPLRPEEKVAPPLKCASLRAQLSLLLQVAVTFVRPQPFAPSSSLGLRLENEDLPLEASASSASASSAATSSASASSSSAM
jgi:hypothetical protein